MTEKSGIEMLEEILRRLDIIEQSIGVLDKNIKSIANSTKMADLINKAVGTPLDGFARAHNHKNQESAREKIEKIKAAKGAKAKGFANFKFDPVDASKLKSNIPVAKKGLPVGPTKVMVSGKMMANIEDKMIPLSSVSVKIFDENDMLVKETKTNRAGHWMGQLKPGKYVALFEGELNGQKLVPQNKTFEVPKKLPEGQSSFEVI